ncbi:MAG: AbrB/MazE/SpoVT family DNA-binding domain-containing protein [Oscillospiraceae bacterium]|nr:AbrB/MazE/SpoVT family DNA-binding domain-containing protein [Oscillospiraceae bacterium]
MIMKATGIVRRIDDLGRVVIPKEIRRTMRIREGDPLEIYTAVDGEVIFKKYSPMGEMSEFASAYADVLHRAIGEPVLISDRDRIVAAAGITKREAVEKRISSELENMMENRENYVKAADKKPLYPIAEFDKCAAAAYTILGNGDVSGAVILLQTRDDYTPSISDIKLIEVASRFIGKQTES